MGDNPIIGLKPFPDKPDFPSRQQLRSFVGQVKNEEVLIPIIFDNIFLK